MTARSNPRSSTVAPTITRPSPRGTTYTRSVTTTRSQGGSAGARRVRISPLTGRTGGRARARNPLGRPGPATAGEQDVPGRIPGPVTRDDALDPLGPADRAGDLGARDHLGSGALGGGGQRAHQRPGVDGGLVGSVDGARAARGEARLQPSRLAGAQHARVEVQRAHQLMAPAKLGRLVGVECHVKRAQRQVPHVGAAGLGQLGRERRPGGVRVKRQAQQTLLAPGCLADGRQHPGGHARRPGAGAVALEHRDREACLGGAPGAREPDRARADDNQVHGLMVSLRHVLLVPGSGPMATIPAPALPGSGSDGRRPCCRPLSPRLGSRYGSDGTPAKLA